MMILFSLALVFVLEQYLPLPYHSIVARPLAYYLNLLENLFNAGKYWQGLAGWLVFVLPSIAVALGGYLLLNRIHPLFGGIWNVCCLYLTVGFRQFSSHFTAIQQALENDDLATARRELTAWRDAPTSAPNASEIARLSIELALAASHRHVFGVLFWFFVLPGPLGVVLYRLSAVAADHWRTHQNADNLAYGKFSLQFFHWLDWLSVRSTALLFAIAGNFEDAISSWRQTARSWKDKELGIVLSSGAGAIGVNLSISTQSYTLQDDEVAAELSEIQNDAPPSGEVASVHAMPRTTALGLRSALICLGLALLLALAGFVD